MRKISAISHLFFWQVGAILCEVPLTVAGRYFLRFVTKGLQNILGSSEAFSFTYAHTVKCKTAPRNFFLMNNDLNSAKLFQHLSSPTKILRHTVCCSMYWYTAHAIRTLPYINHHARMYERPSCTTRGLETMTEWSGFHCTARLFGKCYAPQSDIGLILFQSTDKVKYIRTNTHTHKQAGMCTKFRVETMGYQSNGKAKTTHSVANTVKPKKISATDCTIKMIQWCYCLWQAC